MLENKQGLIIKNDRSIYYVKTNQGIIECCAKGIFFKKNKSPMVGDLVLLENIPDNSGVISQILPRKNSLIRPPISNLDQIFIIVSTCEPKPNFLIIDKLISIAEYKKIEPIIIITKCDLYDFQNIKNIYLNSGLKVFLSNSDNDLKNLKKTIYNKMSCFIGNSGVGKSTLLNKLIPNITLQTGEISQKLGRGKHTTREVNLIQAYGGYIADTPGFSTVEISKYDIILKNELEFCFREFENYRNCKFKGCSHTIEKGCGILDAVSKNQIERIRHKNYISLYEEAKKIKEWELK